MYNSNGQSIIVPHASGASSHFHARTSLSSVMHDASQRRARTASYASATSRASRGDVPPSAPTRARPSPTSASLDERSRGANAVFEIAKASKAAPRECVSSRRASRVRYRYFSTAHVTPAVTNLRGSRSKSIQEASGRVPSGCSSTR